MVETLLESLRALLSKILLLWLTYEFFQKNCDNRSRKSEKCDDYDISFEKLPEENDYGNVLREINTPPPSVHRIQDVAILAFPVVRSPPSRLAISNALQKKFEDLLPGEFLAFVFDNKNLTLRDRQYAFHAERYRRKSFMIGWPHESIPSLNGILMADAGFYFAGDGDKVKCPFCEKTFSEWKISDVPAARHKEESRDCIFVEDRAESGNIKYHELINAFNSTLVHSDVADSQLTIFNEELRGASYRNGAYPVSKRVCEMIGLTETLQLRKKEAKAYICESARLCSFNTAGCPDKANYYQRISEAGFYYASLPNRDTVRCFSCELELESWADDDDPLEAHARHSPSCSFLIARKGQEYVDQVKAKYDAATSHTDKANRPRTQAMLAPQNSVNSSDEEEKGRCKKCEGPKAPAAFVGLPCGHLVYCVCCNKGEYKKKTKDSAYEICCPFVNCGELLNATIRVYT